MKTYALFDISGKLLASFKPDESFNIDNVSINSHIDANGLLRLSKSVTIDTRCLTYKKVLRNLKKELSQRRIDCRNVEKDIFTLVKKIKKGGESGRDLNVEMSRLVMLKGQHKKRISELENQSNISITYQKNCTVRSVTLQEGIFAKLPWFPTPIMWCAEIEEETEEHTLEVTEDVPIKHLEEEIKYGALYAVGGDDGITELSSAEMYDPEHNKWILIPEMSSTRKGPSVAAVGDQLYVAGGYNGICYTSSMIKFDPNQNKWTTVANMQESKSFFGMEVFQDHLYIMGGFNDKYISSVERYHPEENKWFTMAPMNYRRAHHGVAVVSGYLYAVGGRLATSRLSSLERYDPNWNKWDMMAPMKYERSGVSVAVIGGQLYAIGGYDGTSYLSSVERYDPKTNSWTDVAPLTFARASGCATALGDQLYVMGGLNSRSIMLSAEKYDPFQNKWTTIAGMNFKRSYFGIAVIDISEPAAAGTTSTMFQDQREGF